MAQGNAIGAQCGAVEAQRPLTAVLEQVAQILQSAAEHAASINQRLIPSNSPNDKVAQPCPPPSGVVGQANDLRNRAQRLCDELQQISERL